jgi:hypothetical protein
LAQKFFLDQTRAAEIEILYNRYRREKAEFDAKNANEGRSEPVASPDEMGAGDQDLFLEKLAADHTPPDWDELTRVLPRLAAAERACLALLLRQQEKRMRKEPVKPENPKPRKSARKTGGPRDGQV